MMLYLETLFILLFAHCLVDFPLQGDYLAKSKDPTTNLKEYWIVAMFSHCMIHAGAVFIITGNLFLGLFQLVTHFAIDYAKCKQWFGENQAQAFVIDQLFHICALGIIASTHVYYVSRAI